MICYECNGTGWINNIGRTKFGRPIYSYQATCHICGGSGKLTNKILSGQIAILQRKISKLKELKKEGE